MARNTARTLEDRTLKTTSPTRGRAAERPLDELEEYGAKRDFTETPEPAPRQEVAHRQPIFVIQKHDATRLHYDFRLEADGVLKSWAVTKEPSLDPSVKRLAIHVEDHPLSYASFAGTIPEGHYGAGEVDIWDSGTFENLTPDSSIVDGLRAGKLSFVLNGKRLHGRFSLVRMAHTGKPGKKEQWLLIKGRDEFAAAGSSSGDGGTRTPTSTGKRAEEAQATHAAQATRSRTAPAEVAITHPDKVMVPEEGYTKQDIIDYYRAVAPLLLPFLANRPMTLERLPDGVGPGKPHFWQKHTPPGYPEWIPRIELDTEDGGTVPYLLVNDLTTLLYLVNQGTLTFHPWLSRIDHLDRPDFVLFDLDPGPAPFADVILVARKLHAALARDGHEAVVKTSGKTGLHVLVPWNERGGFDESRAWALQVAAEIAAALPAKATTDIRKAKHGDRVYIDVMQNARGKHVVPPYVPRAVPAATVSMPLRWPELRSTLTPGKFTIRTALARLARQKDDPMAPLLAEI
jgi:bifunctional non-homologous end joining protein LigD